MSNPKSIIRNPSHEYIEDQYYVKSVQILVFFLSVFYYIWSEFSANTGK